MPDMPKIDIRPDHWQIVCDILQQHVPEHEVWAFGSRAKWLAKEYSDLDLCILGKAPLSFRTLGKLEEAFEESDLPYKVDIVDWATTSESFRKVIEKDRVVVRKVGRCMGAEWLETTLGEIIELKRGYDLPQAKRIKGTVPIVSSSGISAFHNKAMVKAPGVVTGRYGTIGQVFFIEQDFWPLNTSLYVLDFKGNDPEFISYFLKTIDFLAYSDKGAVPGVNRNHLHMAQVKIPPVETQRSIAHILRTIDKKIALNRQINQTLEQMAQAIFKSWFVDFDPVRAKMAGRDTGLPAHIADLVPDELVESELGLVPRGWGVGSIGDIAIAKGGYAFKGNEFVSEGSTVVKIKNITGDGRVDLAGSDCIDDKQAQSAERFKPNDGDLLMAMTGATVGKIGLVATEGKSVYLKQRVAKFESVKFGPKISWFLYCCFNRQSIFETVVGAAQGSAQPNISSAGIESTKMIVPSDDLIRIFCDQSDLLFKKWLLNINENSTLAIARDALLPKLLSGEIKCLG